MTDLMKRHLMERLRKHIGDPRDNESLAEAEIERLRAALSSLGRAAKTLVSCCIDAQNNLYNEHGAPAKQTLRDIEECLETMAAEAAEAAGDNSP